VTFLTSLVAIWSGVRPSKVKTCPSFEIAVGNRNVLLELACYKTAASKVITQGTEEKCFQSPDLNDYFKVLFIFQWPPWTTQGLSEYSI